MHRNRRVPLFKQIVITMIVLTLLSAAFVLSLKQQIHQKYLANATANAIKNNNEQEALMLLKKGVHPNYKYINYNTLIMLAI